MIDQPDVLHVRSRDADLDAFAARIAELLLGDTPVLVDISRHDERCDRIDLHVTTKDPDVSTG